MKLGGETVMMRREKNLRQPQPLCRVPDAPAWTTPLCDEDLRKERSDEIPEAAKAIMRELGIDPDTWEY